MEHYNLSSIQAMYDYKRELTQRLISDISRKREEQIIKVLAECGFEFKNRDELIEFAKTRCTITSVQNEPKKTLHVDGIPVCYWYETTRVKQEGNTFSVVVGEEFHKIADEKEE